jgi:outer membrane protein assembly factor BamA
MLPERARRRGDHLRFALAMIATEGCAATFARGRARVRDVDLRGVSAVPADELRAGIATQETSQWPAQRPRFLRWWRWWWVTPSYLDEAAANRDRLRIHRFYESRGFYDVQVEGPEVVGVDGRPRALGDRGEGEVRVAYQIREGEALRVEDVRVRGCDDARLGPDRCQAFERALTLRPGMNLDESRLVTDRAALRDLLVADGWATPVVVQRAMVDPSQHRAWIEYAIDPGAARRSRFGQVRLLLTQGATPITGDHLPNGLPTAPIRSALSIDPGATYSRASLATAQQSLFDLGAFSSARIEEVPRADGTVDLDVRLAAARLWKVRLGGGVEVDNTRSNLHLLFGYEHRNAFGGFRRFRAEFRPMLFFPSAFSPSDWESFEVNGGVAASLSLEQPELFRHTSGMVRVQGDYGPDPVNPQTAFRLSVRASISLQHRFTSSLTAGLSLRFVDLEYEPNRLTGNDATALARDPLFRQQFFNQRWIDLEATLTWDRRDDRNRPRSGHLLTANVSGSVRSPVSDYSFVRVQAEARGFVPVSRNVVLAMRGSVGLAAGETYLANGRWYWPVPPEQRFFLGGTQSHRGYPFNRVGPIASSPMADTQNGGYREDPTRVTALGGTAMWQVSAELRWQPGDFGAVFFAEAGNVAGFDPAPFTNPQARALTTCTSNSATPLLDFDACAARGAPLAPPAPPPLGVGQTLELLVQRFNPVVGLGLRYQTPIGPIRLDVGFRLDDLDCQRTGRELAAQNAASPSGRPFFYVNSAPRCDFFGLPAPAALHLSVGEAY